MKNLISKIGKEKFFVLIAVAVLLIVAIVVSAVFISKKSNVETFTVKFDYNYDGSIAPVEQKIPNGDFAVEPEIPSRDGYVFYGWLTYPDVEAWSQNPADLSTFSINEDITFYAIWYSDEFDEDGDGLSHADELLNKTDAFKYDTDGDGISDGDEVNNYNTNPCESDSDEDGIADGTEVALGLNPLNSHSDGVTHDTERKLEAIYEDFDELFDLKITSKANMLSTVSVQTFDNDVISDPTGLISPVIDVQYEKTYSFDAAELVFDYSNSDLSGINENDLIFLYINEETGKYEEISSVIDKEKKIIIGKPTHFSAYVVGDKKLVTKSVSFSPFMTSITYEEELIRAYDLAVTGFDVQQHGYAFSNFVTRNQPGGVCYGMAWTTCLNYIEKLPISGLSYLYKGRYIPAYNLFSVPRYQNNKLYYESEKNIFNSSNNYCWTDSNTEANEIKDVLNCIIHYWGKQPLLSDQFGSNLEKESNFKLLIDKLKNDNPVPLSMYKYRDFDEVESAHAILAYGLYYDISNGVENYYILVYDSNYPGEKCYIRVTTKRSLLEKTYVLEYKGYTNFQLSDDIDLPDDESLFIKHTTEETTSPTPETTEHVHSYTSTDNAASCTKEVKIVYTCSCGESYTETLPMIEHNYVNNVCSMCGLKKEVFSEGLEYKLSGDKTYYSLVGIGSCTDVDIIIPSVYEGLPVTEIESEAFKGNKTIKSVVIPESVKTIGISAFNNVVSLESVTFKEGLVSIEYGAFSFCDNLTKIVLPQSLRRVSQVFACCPKLTDITLNEGLIEIGFGSFEAYSPFGNYNDVAFSFYGNGKYLGTKDNPYYAFMELADPFNNKNCEIHKDTKIIASEAFANGIIEELVIPDGVKAIGTYAFLSCPKLKTLKFGGVVENLPALLWSSDKTNITFNEYEGALYLGNDSNPYLILFSVKDKNLSSYTIHPDTKQIADNAFRGCSSLKAFVIPDNITVVGKYAFAECKALTEIVIPKSITRIPTGMLYDCTAITEFTIPNHIVSIGDYAFRGCSELAKVVMKNNVKYIGKRAFAVCSKLKTIDYYGTEAEWNKVETGKNWNLTNQYLSPISVNIIEHVTLDAGASEGIVYIKSKDEKYYYVVSLGLCTDTDIIISANYNGLPVELINKNAFENCKNIVSVTIPSSVKTIDSSAFKNCTALRSVKLAEGVEKIAFLAFEGCTALEEVNIPSTCTLENAFVGCTSLKTLNISPANTSLKMIGDCLISVENDVILALGEQKIPEGVGIDRILSNAFYHAAIKEIVIPEGVTTIDLIAFDSCAKLEKVTFPKSLKSIGNAAFRDCKSLREVFIPENVNTLGINPFNGCTAITSIMVDTENKTYKAVESCIIDIAGKKLVTGFSTSKIPNDGSVTVIGQAAFSGIDNIKNIEINNNITKIEEGAFMECHGIEKLVIPDSVTEIGSTVIYQMNSLTELVLGNGVTSLDCIYCSSLKNLQKLTIGNGITVIEKYDLMSCTASEIVLSKSIKKIEASAICWCDNLNAIRYEGTVAEWNAIEKETGWDNGTNNYTIYCSDGEIKKSN